MADIELRLARLGKADHELAAALADLPAICHLPNRWKPSVNLSIDLANTIWCCWVKRRMVRVSFTAPAPPYRVI